jgi:hypothetical protein
MTPTSSTATAAAANTSTACDSAAQPLGLRQLDERVPRVVNDVGMSRTVAYLAVAPQLPMLAEALKPSIEQWRTMPFAGGLRD